MKYPFVHLHNHTEYSTLDGCAKVKPLLEAAKAMGQTAMAITDHGNMFGAIPFYKAAKEVGIKPIIGCEMYLAPQTMNYKHPIKGVPPSFHLILLAKNYTGYQNLMKLVSIAYQEGFYYKPRVDKALLRKYSDGLICMTACIKGEANWWRLHNEKEKARQSIYDLADIFGKENFYLEIHNHGIEEEDFLRPKLIKLARKEKFGICATNDIHYIEKAHALSHDVLLCIQTGKKITDEDRMKYTTHDLYLKTGKQMYELFPDCPKACETTVEIAERCDLEIPLGGHLLPKFPLPKGVKMDDYLYDLIKKGMKEKFPHPTKEIKERLRYEFDVIKKMGYAGYFLIVQDFVNWAKSQDVPVGIGRGSASGSLISNVLGITGVNPLEYDLIFERFLNPDRVSMPDIDIDFADRDRERVVDYVVGKYGRDSVAQIATFGRMNARMVLRDVGRVLDIPYDEVDKLAKLIPENSNTDKTKLIDACQQVPDLKTAESTYPELFKHAYVLEGLCRHASVHAAGVIIAPGPITDYSPLVVSKGVIATQYDMNIAEDLGLLKMDFLGLRTLTVIDDTLKMIDMTVDDIPLDDKATYDLYSSGETIGVFQVESDGMRGYLKILIPEDIDDISFLLAAYRPGPLGNGMVEAYIHRKHGEEKIEYPHPLTKKALKKTLGCLIYQESLIKICRDMAGMSISEADVLRKAVGKKKAELMGEQKEKFIKGCLKNNVRESDAEEMFGMIEKFAGYGFNKCLTGDTVVRRSASGRYCKNPNITIKEIYDIFHSPAKTPIRDKYRAGKLKIVGGKGAETKYVNVTDIHYNGIAKVYEIILKSGKKIRATSNHRFLSNKKWTTVDSLGVGDSLRTCDFVYNKSNNHKYNFSGKKQVVKGKKYNKKNPGFPTGEQNPRYIDGGYTKFANYKKIHKSIKTCMSCGGKTRPLEIHHIDFNRSNNEHTNLIKICVSCHKKIHYSHNRVRRGERGYPTIEDMIVSIKYVGAEDVYDLEVSDHSHAFYANGILSHNSHAVGYALLSYYTAYLKANHPTEFMCATLKSESHSRDRLEILLRECERMDIPIIAPDINESESSFTVVRINGKNCIRFGFNAIKGIGDPVAEAIVKYRPYTSIFDMVAKLPKKLYNTAKLTALIDCGCFDKFGSRRAHLEAIDGANRFGRLGQGKIRFYPLYQIDQPTLPATPEWDDHVMLKREFDATGVYITSHPLDKYKGKIEEFKLKSMKEAKPGQIKTYGMVNSVRVIKDRSKSDMAFVSLIDKFTEYEAIVFRDQYSMFKHLLKQGTMVAIKGKVQERDEKMQVVVDVMDRLDNLEV